MKQSRNIRRAAVAATIGLAAGLAPPALADEGTDTAALRKAVSATNIMSHLAALQAGNGGNRAAGTSGYEASAGYIEGKLKRAGYEPVRQPAALRSGGSAGPPC
jgi:hypothetical protein